MMNPQNLALPVTQPKAYHTADFQHVVRDADYDKNGSLNKTEFQIYQAIGQLTGSLTGATKEISDIIGRNFDAIAYRALGKDEITTMDFRATDRTIESADINKLSGFDGITSNISRADVGNLRNGNVSNWPTQPVRPPSNNNDTFLQLLLQIIRLLFGTQR